MAAVGGSGLLLRGLASRATRDVDVVARIEDGVLRPAEEIPKWFFDAVRDVGRELDLSADWINTGPKDLFRLGLPVGFLERCERREFDGLTLYVAGRLDQIHFKLYATADQGPDSRHYQDLMSMEPTSAELGIAGNWCRTHDPSPGFRGLLIAALRIAGWEGADEEL
ncbi:MAG: hypothetical protein O3A20_07070 [Planctomycetota bacterium]|nr:hypothetical protein [Planctomycetota bacterium]